MLSNNNSIINQVLEKHPAILQLSWLLENIDDAVYAKPMELLNGSSIGDHVRHILEFYECLLAQQPVVNYESRKRDITPAKDSNIAFERIKKVISELKLLPLETPCKLTLVTPEGNEMGFLDSTIGRELHYLAEHTIHHLAVIRIAIMSIVPDFEFIEGFGVAASTLRAKLVVS
jgi:hypothetical protein